MATPGPLNAFHPFDMRDEKSVQAFFAAAERARNGTA